MAQRISGIHHVSAITADASKNVEFYAGVLGLRLVKITVNFDDPRSYHLYYGDELGTPGTAMTFFAWAGAYRGRQGPPQVTVTSFSVPGSSLGFWRKRLQERGVEVGEAIERMGDRVLEFVDVDGMKIELVAAGKGDARTGWKNGPVPAEHAIRGFHSVSISEEGYEHTAKLLTETMGFSRVGEEGNRFRFAGSDGGSGSVVDLLCVPDGKRGSMGAGVVHHVAFRTPDDPSQNAWHETLVKGGFNVSPVMDRQYFHSIYFREPGGVLFEIATDGPGFTVDESVEKLGSSLKLPAQYEKARAAIEAALPPLNVPKGAKG